MKRTTRDATSPQLNRADAIEALPEPEDSSHSGIRSAVAPAPQARRAEVTVVFRRAFPMERLVQLIRRRAQETVPATSLHVEVEQQLDSQRWCVRVQSEHGELSASETGPFLAVTRAFALLEQTRAH